MFTFQIFKSLLQLLVFIWDWLVDWVLLEVWNVERKALLKNRGHPP